jgi:hypothetical protein
MESKYNNPYKPPQAKGAYIKPPQFKIAQNAPIEPVTKQDDTSILDLYTQFKTREYDDLMKIIESNEILNFKTDKGETLIFALLNNSSSSLNENNIKNIIELLVVKNVSINTMNEFNQNILHLACKKGYFVVIDYLLELNCNRDLIDNYGNAPIHYVIEEFVKDCKGNEMYNYKNLKTKYLHGNNIDTSYLSKLMMSAIIEEIEGIKKEESEEGLVGGGVEGHVMRGGDMTTAPLTTSLEDLQKFVELNRLFKGKEIEDMMKNNVESIGDKYLELITKTDVKLIKSEIQKKVLEQKEGFKKLYTDFNVNMSDISNYDTFADYARQTQVKIADEKKKCNDTIKEKISNSLPSKCTEIKKVLSEGIYEIYDDSLLCMYILYYIHQSLYSFTKTTASDAMIDKLKSILKKYITNKKYRYINFSTIDFITKYEIKYSNTINDRYRVLQYSDQYLDAYNQRNPRPGPTYMNIVQQNQHPYSLEFFGDQIINDKSWEIINQNYDIFPIEYKNIINNKDIIHIEYSVFVLDNVKMIYDYINKTMDILIDDANTLGGEEFTSNGVGGSDCTMIIKLYALYELILNIINNLILIKYDLTEQFKINELELEINDLKGLMMEPITLIYDKDIYDNDVPRVTNFANEFFENHINAIDTVIRRIRGKIENVDNILNSLYKKLQDCVTIFNDVIEAKNKYWGLCYTDKYIQCLLGLKPESIDCNFYNSVPKINLTFPPTFLEYYLKYRELGKIEPDEFVENNINYISKLEILIDIMNNHLIYIHDYNYNKLFKKSGINPILFNSIYLRNIGNNTYNWNVHNETNNLILQTLQNSTKFNTGYFTYLYKYHLNRNVDITKLVKKDSYTTDFYNKLGIEPDDDDTDKEYKFLRSKSTNVCTNNIIPIALNVANYLIPIIVAKIVFMVADTEVVISGAVGGGGQVGGSYDGIIDKVVQSIGKSQNKNAKELEMMIDSLRGDQQLLKKFVNQYIIKLIEENISIYINDECGQIIKQQVEKIKIVPAYQVVVTLAELQFLEVRSGINILQVIEDLRRESGISQLIVNIYSSRSLKSKPSGKKVFKNKCTNASSSNFECIRRLGIRLKDRNGNTVLNRLIDQYNLPAIETLIGMDSGIKTFRNNRNQTPQEYTASLIKIIADKYDENTIKSRIAKYGYLLKSYLEPIAATNTELELFTDEEFIVTVIKYNLCMFNEYLWFKMYEFNNNLTLDDIENLKAMIKNQLKIDLTEETILINKAIPKIRANEGIVQHNTFGNEDIIAELEDEIKELENKRKQLLLIDSNADTMDINAKIDEKQASLASYDKVKSTKFGVDADDINYIETNSRIISNYSTYEQNIKRKLFYKLYYDVIRLCFEKEDYYTTICNKPKAPSMATAPLPSQPKQLICNLTSLILRLQLGNDKSTCEKLLSFYNHFVDKIYEDYHDLDTHEDAEYNYIQYTILMIIKINVGYIIANELLDKLTIYCNKNFSNAINNSKKDTNYNIKTLFSYMQEAIIDEIIDKLGVANPDKQYTKSDRHDEIIFDGFKSAYSFVESEKNKKDIKDITDFYRIMAGNIAKNSYDEMQDILDDMKKKSLLTAIYTTIS